MDAADVSPVSSEAVAGSSRDPAGSAPGDADPARTLGQSAQQAGDGPRILGAALAAAGPPSGNPAARGP
eukprot:8633970-Pyramimonas_sp.AAC.1